MEDDMKDSTTVNDNNKLGLKFGYNPDYFETDCSVYYEAYRQKNITCDNLPKKISIITFNIWGIFGPKNSVERCELSKLMEFRMNMVCDTVLESSPDIVFFQEVSNEAYKHIRKRLYGTYNYSYEENFNMCEELGRGHTVEVMVFTKFKPKEVVLYILQGNCGYNNAVMVVRYNDTVFFNCYLQAGSKLSPGQLYNGHHFSRCRAEEFGILKSMINQYREVGKDCVVCGDFNCDLNGSIEEWPELEVLKSVGLTDSWKNLYSNSKGYTEDTYLNKMRYWCKLKHKRVRFDGVLTTDGYEPVNAKIVGKKGIIVDGELKEIFLKYKSMLKDIDKVMIWPSDHFGYCCQIQRDD